MTMLSRYDTSFGTQDAINQSFRGTRRVNQDVRGYFGLNEDAHVSLTDETLEGVLGTVAHEVGGHGTSYITFNGMSRNNVMEEVMAIMFETERGYGDGTYRTEPHATAQRLVRGLLDIEEFVALPFSSRWNLIGQIKNHTKMGALYRRFPQLESLELGSHVN